MHYDVRLNGLDPVQGAHTRSTPSRFATLPGGDHPSPGVLIDPLEFPSAIVSPPPASGLRFDGTDVVLSQNPGRLLGLGD